ncbi:hypothetical protein [Actinospica robiniae]|uniref:hypothetical protein n=1 Tax=Actinospica robiniae TaxID=304901 RepID=UPI0012FBD24F|nr:hypothetical protein [Actinospica robiniae]
MSMYQTPGSPAGYDPNRLFTGPHPQSGTSRPHVVPGTAHVFVTADGDYTVSDRRISTRQAFSAKRRYDVDLTDRATEWTGSDLPSMENGFYFEYAVSLAWRVHDPATVVRRGIDVKGAESAIRQKLLIPMHEIATACRPEQWSYAESQLNSQFAKEMRLDIGISVFRFTAHLHLDPAIAAQLAERARVRGRIEIDAMTREEVERALQRGEFGVLVEHLTKNDDSTREVLKMVLDARRVSEQERQELRTVLLKEGVIQDVDLARYLDYVLPPAVGPAPGPGVLGPSGLALTGGSAIPPPVTASPGPGGAAPLPPAPPAPPPPTGGNVTAPPPADNSSSRPLGGVIAWDDVEPSTGTGRGAQ